MIEKGQVIGPGESTFMEIPLGIRTTFSFNVPYEYVITTTGGTTIEGSATYNSPLVLTAGPDIAEIKLMIAEGAFLPIRLVK